MSEQKEKKMATAPKRIDRSSRGLRDALFDELDALRAGKSNHQRATAVAKLASQVIDSAKMEIEYQKYILSKPNHNGALLTSPISLGKAA